MNQYQKEMQHLLQLQDQRVNRQLYNLYVDIVKELKKSLLAEYQSYENLSRSKKMDLKRMSAMLEAIDSQSQKLKTGLNGTIPDHLERVGKMAYNELFYEYEQTRSAIQFALLPEEELKTIIETPVAGLRLSQRISDGVVSDLRKNIKSELTRSFVHGLSYQRTAKRLSELGSSSYRRALNITRTEAGRVSAIARQRSQKEAVDLGIEFKKMWVATLDKRTRNTHQHLDGQQVGPEEYFEHNGLRTLQPHMFGIASEDCNCRCRTISRLKDDDTPLLRRDSETGEAVEYKNYREWEKARGYEVKKSKSLEKATDKVYNQGMKNLDLMGKHRRFNAVGKDEQTITAKTRKKEGSVFDIWLENDTKNSRDTADLLQGALERYNPEDMPTFVILSNKKLSRGKRQGLAAYDYTQNVMFLSNELISEENVRTILSDNHFAARDFDELLEHELTHKTHWDNAKKLYKQNPKRYNTIEEAKRSLDSKLLDYVGQQRKTDRLYVKTVVSPNAHFALLEGNVNELVADVNVLSNTDRLSDTILLNLVKEVLGND